MSQALAVSENFVQISLEIMEDIGSIKILDIDEIQYIKSFDYEKFKQNSLFEVLKDEFVAIIEFKKSLLNCDVVEIEELLLKS